MFRDVVTQPSLRLKKIFISLLAGGLTAAMLLVGVQTVLALQAIQQLWRGHSHEATLHVAEISQVRQHFGYGGLSRHFHRYLVDPSAKHQQQVEQAIVRLFQSIERVEQLSLAPLERMAINAIAEVAGDYRDAYLLARRQLSQSGLADNLQERLVDDAAAVNALRLLDELALRRVERAEEEARARLEETISGIYWGGLLLPLLLLLTMLLLHFLSRISRANAELERLRGELDSLLEYAPEAILVCSPGGWVQRINRRAEALFAYPRQEIQASSLTRLMPDWPEGADGWQAWHGSTRQIRAGNGDLVPVEVSIGQLEHQQHSHLIITLRDISEQQQARQQIEQLNRSLLKQNQALASVNRELEAFSYSVSHDLRTPLRGIDGFSQLLTRRYEHQLDAVGQDYLQRITKATSRMGQIIDDMLQLSKTTRAPMKPGYLNLSALAEQVSLQLSDDEPERICHWHIEAGLYVVADEGLMRVLLENLLGNAWKYSANEVPSVIHFGAELRFGEWVFHVRDNGVGFDMQYADKLFGAFQRLHGVEEFEGTGIGLSTVQRIIHRHGGKVWAESTPGDGASFYFTLGKLESDMDALSEQDDKHKGEK